MVVRPRHRAEGSHIAILSLWWGGPFWAGPWMDRHGKAATSLSAFCSLFSDPRSRAHQRGCHRQGLVLLGSLRLFRDGGVGQRVGGLGSGSLSAYRHSCLAPSPTCAAGVCNDSKLPFADITGFGRGVCGQSLDIARRSYSQRAHHVDLTWIFNFGARFTALVFFRVSVTQAIHRATPKMQNANLPAQRFFRKPRLLMQQPGATGTARLQSRQ